MNKEHPPAWSDDPLSTFFNDCEYNARACAGNYPDVYALLKSTHAAFVTAQAALEKDAMTTSESERTRREQDLARMTREFQRAQREYREDLNQRRNEKLADLFQRANRVIQQIAEAEKFDLILQEAVYRSPRIDITDKVLKALGDK